MPTAILPATEQEWLKLRTQDVTSTETAALFGLSPYMSKFELWHRKASGEVPEFKTNERMVWGTRLQDVIARGIAEDQGWNVRKLNAYIRRDDGIRMGSSFDFEIVSHENGPGILEIKTVDTLAFRDGWLIDGDNIEAPEHIEIQLQHQLEVTGRRWGVIGALIGGNTVKLLHRERDREVGQLIVRHIEKFWMTVDAGTPPEPDYPRDADMVCKLNGYAEPGKVYDATGDDEIASLTAEYSAASIREKEAKEDKDTARAKLLEKVGTAEKIILPGYSISAGMIGPTIIETYERKGYRNFRVTAKKVK